MPFNPPEKLRADHNLQQFSNGVHPSLDEWLRSRALVSEGLSARTYVVTMREDPSRIVAYYALSAAKEQRHALPQAKLRRGMPDEIPMLLLGRLAVDGAFRGQGLGTALVADALRKVLLASSIAGIRAVVTHAIDDAAVKFYLDRGFVTTPIGERTLLIPIETVRDLFAG